MEISSMLINIILVMLLANTESFSSASFSSQKLSFLGLQLETASSMKTNENFKIESRSRGFALTALSAARKRRRRRIDSEKIIEQSIPEENGALPPGENLDINDDELPDFDLGEKEQLPELLLEPVKKIEEKEDLGVIENVENQVSLIDKNDPILMQAMQGSKSSQSFSSQKDLLRSRDRDLEATFEFETVKQPLPKPGQKKVDSIGGDREISTGGGKKRARAEARRAAAKEAAANEVQNNVGMVDDVMSKLPFYPKTEEGEEKTPLKLLEQGTWACIYILLAWEVYINSPFFDRAQPIIPVVY